MNQAILAVEENTLNLSLLMDLLQNSGYNVLEARDGMEGAEMAREHCPNLVVLE